MKTKNENKKFSLEKFEIAKLQNPKLIFGGDAGLPTNTNTKNGSTVKCVQDNPLKP